MDGDPDRACALRCAERALEYLLRRERRPAATDADPSEVNDRPRRQVTTASPIRALFEDRNRTWAFMTDAR